MYRRFNCIFLVLILCFLAGSASNLNFNDTIPLDSTVRYGKLINGLTYYIQKIPGEQKVVMQFHVKAGVYQQDKDQLELAHTLEHILSQPFFDPLKNQGLMPGRDFNAATGDESTYYWINLPSNDKANIEIGVKLFRQISCNRPLDSAAIENGRKTVLNEIMKGQGERSIIDKIHGDVDPVLLVPVSQNINNVKIFKHATLRRFYEKWYQSNREAVIIVGNIDIDLTEAILRESLSDLKNNESPGIDYMPGPIKNQHFLIIDQINNSVNISRIVKHKSFNLYTANDYRRSLIIDLYNEMSQARFNNIKETIDKPVSIRHGYFWKFPFVASEWIDMLVSDIQFLPGTTKEKIAFGYKLLLKEEKRIEQYGFLSSEFVLAKETILKQKSENLGEPLIRIAARYEQHFLGKYSAPNKDVERQLYIDLLTDISLGEVYSESKKWKSQQPAQVLLSGKNKFLENEIRPLVARLDKKNLQIKVAPYHGTNYELRPVMSPEQVKSLDKDKIYYSATKINELGGFKYRLRNGIQIILQPVKVSSRKPDKILLRAYRAGKGSIEQNYNSYAAVIAYQLLMSDSVSSLSRRELDRWLSKNRVEVSVGPTDIRGESLAGNVEILMQCIYQLVMKPKFTAASLSRLKLTYAMINKRDSSIFGQISGKYDPSVTIEVPKAVLDTITIESITQAYQQYSQDKHDYTFVFTGNFNVDSVSTVIIKYLDALTSASGAPQPTRYTTIIPSDKSDSYLVQQDYGVEKSYNAFFYVEEKDISVSKKMQLEILKQLLNEVLQRKLREDMGGTYFATSELNQIGSQLFRIVFQFSTNNNEPERMMRAAWHEIEQLQTNGPSEQLLKTVISQALQNIETDKHGHYLWHEYFYWQYFNERDLDEMKNWKTELEKITVSDMRECAQKFLRHDDLQTFHIGK